MIMKTNVTATCNFCGNTGDIDVDTHDLVAYHAGALVQDAFPALSLEDREIIIAQRTGFYVCPTCWDNELTSEE